MNTSAENRLWLAILARTDELRGKTDDQMRLELRRGGFPEHLIDLYLQRERPSNMPKEQHLTENATAKKTTPLASKTVTDGGRQAVVESRVRDVLERNNIHLRLDGEFIPALSAKVEELTLQAAKRAQENGRQTIRPSDL